MTAGASVPVVLTDDDPARLLAALDGPGPVAVLDHRATALVAAVDAALPAAPPGAWLVALTSGSTAVPRAVCRTRASWEASVAPLAAWTGVGPGLRVLVPGPLSSTLFLHAAWHTRRVGAELLLAPLHTNQPWDVVHLVPHQLDRLLASEADVRGRTAVVAGAALAAGTAARAAERGLLVLTYYGAAELSFVARARGAAPLSPFPGAQVDVRDGLLWVRSPYLASGYLPLDASGPPAPLQRDGEGWASVGDRARLVPRGIVVLGRGDTAVQTGGATVPVADVEAVLREAPGVRDAAVVGTSHPVLGEVVTAVVEASPQTRAATLRAWSRPRLSAEQQPRRWLLVDALPRTAAGKVDRAATAALAASGAGGPGPSIERVPAADLVIDARYCGPPTSANGGYAAGLLARRLLEAHRLPTVVGPWVEVTLRAPIPLDTAMHVAVDGEALTAHDGEALVAQARLLPGPPDGDVAVPAVPAQTAADVAQTYLGLEVHPFPTCWVCGPQRPAGDGYHLAPGRVDDDETACLWRVAPSVASASGEVPVEAVWAALDCPGAWTALVAERVVVLGRLSARILDVPAVGEQCVVMGRRLASEGRKTFTATTVYGGDGRELGRAVAVWIEVPTP